MSKAKENGIETLTLDEASEVDWAKYPIKPAITVMTEDIFQIHNVLYMDGAYFVPITSLGLDSRVELNGEQMGNLGELVQYFFQQYVIPQLIQYKKKHFLDLFKDKANLDKTLIAEDVYDWPDIVVDCVNGKQVELKKVKYIVHGNRKSEDVEQAHYVFNKKMVSTGKHLDADGSVITFYVIQDPDTQKISVRSELKGGDKSP